MKKLFLLPLTIFSVVPFFTSCGSRITIDTKYLVNLVQTRNQQTQPINFPGTIFGDDKLKSTIEWFQKDMILVENDLLFDCFQFIDTIENSAITFDNYFKLDGDDTIISLWSTKKLNVNVRLSDFLYEINETNNGWNIKPFALMLNFQFTANYPSDEDVKYKVGEVLSFTYWLANCSIIYSINSTTNILEHQFGFIGTPTEKSIYGIFERPTDPLKRIDTIYTTKTTNFYKYC